MKSGHSLMHKMLGALALGAAIPALAIAQTSGSPSADAAMHAYRPSVGATVVKVVAHEYAFTLPDTISAGLTTFEFEDQGAEPHHFFLARLDDGKTLGDALAALSKFGPAPSWVHMVGGPNAVVPHGGKQTVTLDVAAGHYVLYCVVPGPDGIPHVAKGMMKDLIVTPSSSPGKAKPPVADISVTLSDYDFTFSKPLTAGSHILKVTNSSAQPHEMLIVKLPPGKTAKDFGEWGMKPQGPPPAMPLGGVTSIAPGSTIYMQGEFTPGTYGLLCFEPDHTDSEPHFRHGMHKEIVVK